MKIFISGGVKCGKSYCAQRLASIQRKDRLYYVATMLPSDSEDRQRIERHITDRAGWGFETVERHRQIEGILGNCEPNGSFLLDSLTALMANEMFYESRVNFNAASDVIKGLGDIFKNVDDIVIVSDFLYSDGNTYDSYTEAYRRLLAAADRFCAENCDIVIELLYGIRIVYKGSDLLKGLERL